MTNGDTFEFDPELCDIFGMDIDKYPRNMKPGTPIGAVTEEVSRKCGLKVGTPLFVGSGDQQCGAAGVGNSGEAGLGSVCLGTAGLCIATQLRRCVTPTASAMCLAIRQAATRWKAMPRRQPLPSGGAGILSAGLR